VEWDDGAFTTRAIFDSTPVESVEFSKQELAVLDLMFDSGKEELAERLFASMMSNKRKPTDAGKIEVPKKTRFRPWENLSTPQEDDRKEPPLKERGGPKYRLEFPDLKIKEATTELFKQMIDTPLQLDKFWLRPRKFAK
jgi:hypothetical protein